MGDSGEERSCSRRADREPGVKSTDRIGQRVASASHSDQLTARVLIGLGAAHCDENTGGLGGDVVYVEGGDLAGSHRGCVAEEDDGSVTDTDGCAHVDGRDDLSNLSRSEWMGLTTRSDPHDPTEPSTHTPHDDINSRIGEALLVMPVSDPGAVPVERPEGETRFCPFGEECGQRFRRRRQGHDPSPLAPALPLAPGTGVRLPSGRGELRVNRRRYPLSIASGQYGLCSRVIGGRWG